MNTRSILTILVVAAVALSATAAGEVGKTYVIHTEDGDVSVVCTGDRSIEAVENQPGFPPSYQWDPLCTSIESGQTVTWSVRAPGNIHDPTSEADAGQCFQGSAAAPRGIGRFIDSSPVVTFTVQFKYEGGIAEARTVVQNADGTFTFGAWHSCPGALDIEQTTLAEAVIPYLCSLHPNMQALIVVEASGTISVG